MSTPADVVDLMRTSSQRWTSLRLVGHEWRHRDTFREAWEHHVDELRRNSSVSVQVVSATRNDGDDPAETRDGWRVWLARPDRRRTEFKVGDDIATAVFVGPRWWSRSPFGIRTNDGDPRHSHGFGPAQALIDPAAYVDSLELRLDGRTEIASRGAYRMTARPRTTDQNLFGHEFHMLGTGADSYMLLIDAEIGIGLRCEARFHGRPFRVVEIDEIAVGEELSADLFDGELLSRS